MKYNKEQIKELILTDYLDGRLSETDKREVDHWIEREPEIREFFEAVKRSSVQPFGSLKDFEPPEEVWLNIKERIERADAPGAPSVWDGLVGRIQAVWKKPRLSFTLASAMAVLIIFVWVGVGRFNHLPVDIKGEQQVEYLMFLSGDGLLENGDMNNGFGSSIEDYFL